MRILNHAIAAVVAVTTVLVTLNSASAQNVTVQVGTPAAPPMPLVNHGDVWRWHKGTNAPQLGWFTNSLADASLDATWGSSAGGFGYSSDTAAETGACATVLFDMRGTTATNYSTFYIRRSFSITNAFDAAARVQLTVDYDDGFVAYLDGVEVARSSNAPLGAETNNAAIASSSHESSRGTSGAAPSVYDVGAATAKLAVGTHVLALVGLNNSISGSTDFILVPDLAVTGASSGTVGGGTNFAIAYSTNIVLSGSNTVVGATRVTINGDDATVVTASNTWFKTNILSPGLNHLFVAALDANGTLLGYTNRDVLLEVSSTNISGTLSGSNFWSPTMGNIHVTANVTIPAGASLTIAPGTVVLFSSGVGMTVNGTLNASGAAGNTIFMAPLTSDAEWGPITLNGTGATIRYANMLGGRLTVTSGPMLVEDSELHHTINNTLLFGTGGGWTLRRLHIHDYHDTEMDNSVLLAEDCLFEHAHARNGSDTQVDPFEMSGALNGTVVQRCTMRDVPSENADAFDFNSGVGVTMRNNLIHDIGDKAFSFGTAGGAASQNMTASNNLIWNVRTGIAVKDGTTANIIGNTIANSLYGVQAYPKYSTNGGRVTNGYNNILWNNGTTLTITNGSMVLNFSDLGGSVFIGTNSGNFTNVGSFNADPLFVNAAAEDYRLSPGSPCIGAGQGGANVGVTLPVGGLPGRPFALAAIANGTNAVNVVWSDDADNEGGFIVERSTNGVNWSVIANVDANTTSFLDESAVGGIKYWYRAAATNSSSASDYSNVASATRKGLVVLTSGSLGGTLTQDTCLADNSIITVSSALTIPAGVTLYIKPGVQVRVNAGVVITVTNTGVLMAVGSETNHIRFTKSGASNWGALAFLNAPNESRLEWVDWDSCAGTTISGHTAEILVNGASKVFIDHLNMANTPSVQYISFDRSSFIVQNSTFPTYNWATSAPEMLHGVNGINAGGYGIFRSNFFGHTFGFNDTIDFTGGQRPGPILQIIGNVFDGAGDDHLDLDSTDAWIEGNIFMHAHRDPNRTDDPYDTASAISGGVDVATQYSEWTIINNLFYDMDHAILVKEGNRFIFANNTLVHIAKENGSGMLADISAFNFTDKQLALPDPSKGAGAYIAGNILWDVPVLAANYNASNETVIFENNILPSAWSGPGSNNVVTDPLLNLDLITTVTGASWQTVLAALTPKTNSPALGTGIGGFDKGGRNPLGMLVFSDPSSPAPSTNATFRVALGGVFFWGSVVPPYVWGYTQYKWRLDNGPWSPEISITNSVTFSVSNLSAGPHTVFVVGKNDAGYYQDDPFVYPSNSVIAAHASASRTWVVGSADTDGDGMPDDWEDANGFNKYSAADAGQDADGDGLTNLQEFLAGTDPHDVASKLVARVGATGSSSVITFNAAASKSYTVQYRDAFTTNTTWLPLTNIVAGAARTVSLTNTPVGPSRFYRIATP